ncbi:MAG TPA: hypothetical protein VK181_11880, partial [Rhizobium sp.]|nr:hypothetical protein [Rhizobium sp.]
CGPPSCEYWLVDPVATYQGVSFTQKQAEAVARLLNSMEDGTGRSMKVEVLNDFGVGVGEEYLLLGSDMEEATDSLSRRVTYQPTWLSLLSMMRLVIEQGETQAAKDAMWEELSRMAKAADKWNEHVREGGK